MEIIIYPVMRKIIIYMNTHCKQISIVNKIVYNQKNFTISRNGVIAKNEGGGVNFSPGESINLESRNSLGTTMLHINSQIRVRKVSRGRNCECGGEVALWDEVIAFSRVQRYPGSAQLSPGTQLSKITDTGRYTRSPAGTRAPIPASDTCPGTRVYTSSARSF